MFFIKKLLKNKAVALAACVIVVCLVYMGVQKAIDNYNFEHNNDIFEEADGVAAENDGLSASGNDNEEGDDSESSVEGEESTAAESKEETLPEVSDEIEVQSKIYVYITGEVNNPGVVVLNEGSRIVDAINAAGGTTAKANVSKVNLVYVLDDGMKVNIPNNNDLKNNSDFEYITMNSGDGGIDDYSGSGSSTAGSSSASVSSGVNEGSSSSSKRYDIVNINTATQTELETLPGIGPSLALKIINHRKENGKFSSIEQIKDVSGIGESKFESLKGYITI